MYTITIRVRKRTRRAERELRSSLPQKPRFCFARSAHLRGAYFPDKVRKVKKTALAVFLEKVFLMGYLIKLQNVLGRLRDYNSKPFQIRKYQGFTNLTKTFCCFCALYTNSASNSSRPIFSFSNKSCAQCSNTSLFSRSIAFAFA